MSLEPTTNTHGGSPVAVNLVPFFVSSLAYVHSAILNSAPGTGEGTLSTPEVGKAREGVDGGNGQKTQVREVDLRASRADVDIERSPYSSVRVCFMFSSELYT